MPQMEQVLNKPLSGAEVRKIILSKLETAMSGDCRLTDYVAFPSFGFKLDLAIVLNGAAEPHDKLNYELTGQQGEAPADSTAHIETVHVEGHPMPPNQARVEAGIGVPVLTRDDRGREIEREIHYAKKSVQKG